MKKKKNDNAGDLAFVLGMSIGIFIGLALTIAFNDIVYFPLYLTVGITVGIAISGQNIEITRSKKEKKEKPIIKIDLNEELEIKTTPKKILLDSIGIAFIIAIIVFLCLTCYRDIFITMLEGFKDFDNRDILEYVLILLPFLYIISAFIKFMSYLFYNIDHKK